MRHYKKGRKLGTDASHTKAMKKNLAVALFTNDRIKTTVPRAKEVRGTVERIITWAKKGDLHSRRLAIAALGDKELVRRGLREGRARHVGRPQRWLHPYPEARPRKATMPPWRFSSLSRKL